MTEVVDSETDVDVIVLVTVWVSIEDTPAGRTQEKLPTFVFKVFVGQAEQKVPFG